MSKVTQTLRECRQIANFDEATLVWGAHGKRVNVQWRVLKVVREEWQDSVSGHVVPVVLNCIQVAHAHNRCYHGTRTTLQGPNQV